MLSQQYGVGKQFRSGRSLSLAAGLSQNQVALVVETGKATAETLMKIGDAVWVPRPHMFVYGGWFNWEDINPKMSQEATQLMANFEEMD